MLYEFPGLEPVFSQYFITDFVGKEVLTPGEKVFVEKVAEKRVKDFSTGRFCARKALEGLGIPNAEILIGGNKEPLWPEGIVGSISHSEKLAGALAAQSETILSMGLDIEVVGGIKQDMWDNLFSEHEQSFLRALSNEKQDLFSTLLFSLKESFYKLQYPLTRTFLEFTDVEIHYENENFSFHSNEAFIRHMPSLAFVKPQWAEFEGQVICFCFLSRQ